LLCIYKLPPYICIPLPYIYIYIHRYIYLCISIYIYPQSASATTRQRGHLQELPSFQLRTSHVYIDSPSSICLSIYIYLCISIHTYVSMSTPIRLGLGLRDNPLNDKFSACAYTLPKWRALAWKFRLSVIETCLSPFSFLRLLPQHGRGWHLKVGLLCTYALLPFIYTPLPYIYIYTYLYICMHLCFPPLDFRHKTTTRPSQSTTYSTTAHFPRISIPPSPISISMYIYTYICIYVYPQSASTTTRARVASQSTTCSLTTHSPLICIPPLP